MDGRKGKEENGEKGENIWKGEKPKELRKFESGKANRENFVLGFQELKFGWERFLRVIQPVSNAPDLGRRALYKFRYTVV